MKLNFIIFLLFCSHFVFSQGRRFPSNCDGKLVVFSDNGNLEPTYELFIKSYADRFKVSQRKYILKSKPAFKELITNIADDYHYEASLMQADVRIELSVTTKELRFKDTSMLFMNKIIDSLIDDQNTFGMVTLEKNKTISEMVLKYNESTIVIPDSLTNNLINPNTCHKYYSITPIKSYYSEQDNTVAIYICGALPSVNQDSPTIERDFRDDSFYSYVAKIVVELSTGNFYRFVLPGRILNHYGWIECDTFWVF